MFIDQEWKKNLNKKEGELDDSSKSRIVKPLYLVILVVFFIIFIFIGFYYFNSGFYLNNNPTVITPVINDSSSTLSGLPPYFDHNIPKDDDGYIPDDLKAEDVNFGSFYEEPIEQLTSNLNQFNLPLNIKSDVINYYDLSRKIDIENKIDMLNKNAFAVLDPQFGSEESDFFKMYRSLIQNEIPLFISSDFIRYYNQNVLKEIYKEIERSVFYENLWDICKKFYDISLSRYLNHLEKVGLVSDPVLEGERLETAFLAVALELLKPKEGQISDDENFSKENLFTEQESQKYYFNIPHDLQKEVLNEVDLIYEGKTEKQSPIFLYKKDYKSFSLPEEYRLDSKLKNYYLTKKWMNSLFPIYYRNEDCEDCLLDYNDWLNNFAAINLLAKDFDDNQDLKNRWATIYKFIAFFEGLRNDLTYLHLNKVNDIVFGDTFNLDLLFENSDKQEGLIRNMQAEFEKLSFLSIEGGENRENAKEKSFIGIRLLQNNFWPNEYIFSELTGTEFVSNSTEAKERITACVNPESKQSYKCLGFSGDVLSIYDILPENKSYYENNFDYENYNLGVDGILDQLKLFDNGTWNSNIFWLNFDLSNRVVKNSASFISKMSLNENWVEEKVVNEILGAWINVALPQDGWENYQMEKNQSFGFVPECNLYSYVEPQVELYSDMIERNKMLIRTIEVLRVGKKTNVATLMLTDLNKKLMKFNNIAQKELNGDSLSEEDCNSLNEIVGETNIWKSGNKKYIIENSGQKIAFNLNGVKLVAFIKLQEEDKKVLVIGPIFNFKEEDR